MSSAALRSVALRRSAPLRISRPRGEGHQVGQRDVLVDRARARARSACGPPGRGRCRGRWRRAARVWRSAAVEAHCAASGAVDAEDGAGEFGAAGADQAGHAEDLARCSERSSACSGYADVRSPRSRAPRLAGRAFGRDVERLQVAADHHADHGVVPDLAARQFADHGAVAQHDDPVGALLDLVQAVRDEDHRHAVALSSAMTFKSRAVSEAVRLEVGSSMMTMRASSDSALAISTSWRWASDSSATGVSASKSTAEPAQQGRHLRRRAPRGRSAAAARRRPVRGR